MKRRLAGIAAAGLALLAWALLPRDGRAPSSEDGRPHGDAPAVEPPAPRAQGPTLAARAPAPAPARRTLPLVVEAEGLDVAEADVYACPDASHWTLVGRVRCGVPVDVEIATTDRVVAAQALTAAGRASPFVEDAEAAIPASPAERVRLRLAPGAASVVVEVCDTRSRPIPGIRLRLSTLGAAEWSAGQRESDGTGMARWDGLRSGLVGEHAVEALGVPAEFRVVSTPVLEIRRSAGGGVLEASGRLVLSRCDGAFRVPLDGAVNPQVVLQRRTPQGAWTSVRDDHAIRLRDADGHRVWLGPGVPLPASTPVAWVEGDRCCEGAYRVQVLGWRGGIGEAEFTVRSGESTEVGTLRVAPSVVVPCRLTGPAAGRTDALRFRIADATPAVDAWWARELLGAAVDREGGFSLVLPAGTAAVRFEGPTGTSASWVIPAANRAVPPEGRTLEVGSRTARRVTGRVLDAEGRGLAGAVVAARVRFAPGRGAGREEEEGGWTEGVLSAEDGRFDVGAVFAGTWLVRADPPDGRRVEATVEVQEDIDATVVLRAP